MATVIADNPTFTGSQEDENKGATKLPDLNPIREEDESGHTSRPRSAVNLEQSEQLLLPPIIPNHETQGLSRKNLLEALGISDPNSLGDLLKNVRAEVKAALEELTTITTHDDNLEKQYKETVAENEQLQTALDRARREVSHLKGQLSILQMTPSEIRMERARTQQKERRRKELERQAQTAAKSRLLERGGTVHVMTAAERARTVNARGKYIDQATYPTRTAHAQPVAFPVKARVEPLPPPLFGCTCSECNAQQSLGALTLNRTLCQHQMINQVTKSGQQILLGDRVVLKGERLGTVCYIGRLDIDAAENIYIGIHLDLPVGNIDGYLKGRRYFQCPSNHGVMVKASDIICVTGRKPFSGGTAVPRVRERLPSGFDISHSANRASKVHSIEQKNESLPLPVSTSPPPTMIENIIETEGRESVESMSKRIQKLAQKSSKKARELQQFEEELKLRTPPTPPPTKVTLDESIYISVDPPLRPVTPQPITPTSRPATAEPSRPAMPLEQTLLDLLSSRDLGATGFVTSKELIAVLSQLTGKRAMTAVEVDQLLSKLGIHKEGVGIPYHTLIPHLIKEIDNREH